MGSEKHSGDGDVEIARSSSDGSAKDEAMAMVGEQQHELDPEVVARVIKKIDWYMIPAMVFGCKLPTLFTPFP
jgi:hypothetical protein